MLKGEEHLLEFWKLQNLHRKDLNHFAVCTVERDEDPNNYFELCKLFSDF